MTEQHGAVEPGFSQEPLSADAHAKAMADYILAGTRRAYELGNRGPIRFDDDGSLDAGIVEAYWRCGFYVFEDVVGEQELADLATDLESVLERAPHEKGAEVDSKGRPALGTELAQRTFLFARPLSDPVGGLARRGRGSLSGTVQGSPQPVSGAAVTLKDHQDGLGNVFATTTSALGFFRIDGVSDGVFIGVSMLK